MGDDDIVKIYSEEDIEVLLDKRTRSGAMAYTVDQSLPEERRRQLQAIIDARILQRFKEGNRRSAFIIGPLDEDREEALEAIRESQENVRLELLRFIRISDPDHDSTPSNATFDALLRAATARGYDVIISISDQEGSGNLSLVLPPQ